MPLFTAKLQLLARHLWMDADDSRRAINPAVLRSLASHVAVSEQRHSGEIRICVEAGLPISDVLRLDADGNTLPRLIRQRAVTVFGALQVWDTEHNNGVLIYLLLAEHAIEIVADRGLVRCVPKAEFDALTTRMAAQFKAGAYEAGLMQAVDAVAALLLAHFASNVVNANAMPDMPVLQ